MLSFNRLKLLYPSLESLIASAAAPFELIIHDDGSIDGPLYEYLISMLHQGNISSLILNRPGHNQGQGTALNRMFSMATGDPILKLDHDLLYHARWLERVQQILATNREDFIAGDPQIGLLGLLHYYHEPVDSRKTKVAQYVGWSEHTHILGSAFAVTRECWQQLGPFEEHSPNFGEDWDFQKRVTASESYVCGLPPEDLVTNVGMGYGPSTVNTEPGKVQAIRSLPYLIGLS